MEFGKMLPETPSKLITTFLLAAVIGILCFWILYILHIDIDSIMADQFSLLDEYDQFVSGTGERLKDLWSPKGGHRFPGYKMLFFLNVYLFGFSPNIEALSAIFIFSIAVFGLTRIAIADLKPTRFLGFLCVITFVLILMNAQTVRLSRYSLIAMRLMDFSLFLLLVGLACKAITIPAKDTKLWIAIGLTLIVAILIFGRGWGMAACAALASLIGFSWLSHKDRFSAHIMRRHGTLLGLVVLTVVVYSYGLPAKSGPGAGFQLGAFASLLSIKLGNANVGLFDMAAGRNIALSQSVTAAYFCFAAVISLYLLIRGKLSRAEWFALFLIYFSIFAAATVSMAKYGQSPFAQRHNFELSVGSFGIVFFMIKFSLTFLNQKLGGVFVGLFCAVLILGLGHNSYDNFKSAKREFRHYDRLETLQQKAYLNPQSVTNEEYRKMSCALGVKNCERIIALMKKHGVAKERMTASGEGAK